MNILIDNKNGTPIYEQIYTQIREQILSGALREDELLPSIRGLAKDLRTEKSGAAAGGKPEKNRSAYRRYPPSGRSLRAEPTGDP